ncbi:MAG: AAA family ATPase [Acidobacteriota bacterium]|nr:AAA family ATPase [Acidobacteriota bacterium]
MPKQNSEVIVIAGGNGVGKTTFARAFLQEYNYEFLNADEIAKSLSAENPSGKKISAGKLFFKRLHEAIAQNKSLLIESTLSGRYLQKFIEGLQKQDYQIRIVFLFVESTEILIERIAERVKKGGHFVSDEDVKRRFVRGKQNFWKTYRNLATRWSLVSNSDRNFQEVAFGEKDEYLIADENLFQIFESEIK